MQRPEYLLPSLNIALRDLLAATQVLQLSTDSQDELHAMMRRLLVAEVMEDKAIIAVGGSQGAGKTTLVCSMYDLPHGDDGWFAPNMGRGETLPVLIEEVEGLQSPEGWVKVLARATEASHRFEVREEKREKKDAFRAACQGADPAVMLPILKVPRRYLADGQALLLLPGYEKQNRQNRVWQDLMRQALIGATSWVIVTDSTRMAGDDQRLIAGDMQAGELRGVHPVIVVSKTEVHENELAKLDELRQRAAEVFGLREEGAWRHVICAGTNTQQHPAYSEIWRPHLTGALRDASRAGNQARQGQLALLRNTLQRDLPRVLEAIRTHSTLTFHAGGGAEALDTVRELLETFDYANAELRDAHAEAIRRVLRSHAALAQKKLDPMLKSDFEGVVNLLKGTLESNRAARQRMQDAVEAAWKRAGDPLGAYFAALGQITAAPLKVKPAADAKSPLQRLGYVDADGKQLSSVLLAEETQGNMLALFNSEAGRQDQVRTNRGLEKTVKLLPAMALEYVRLSIEMAPLATLDSEAVKGMPQGDLVGGLKNVQAQFGELGSVVGKLLKGLGALLAVDIAVDGEIDLVDAVRSLLGLGTTGAATVANPWLAGAAGAGATLFLAHSALQQFRQYEAQVAQLGYAMVRSIEDHWTAHLLTHYDDVTGKLRRALEERLRRRYALDRRSMQRDHLAKALADVEVQRNHLLAEIATSGQGLLAFEAESH